MYNREEFMLKYKNAKERVGYLDGEVASLLACAQYYGVCSVSQASIRTRAGPGHALLVPRCQTR